MRNLTSRGPQKVPKKIVSFMGPSAHGTVRWPILQAGIISTTK